MQHCDGGVDVEDRAVDVGNDHEIGRQFVEARQALLSGDLSWIADAHEVVIDLFNGSL